MRGNRLRWVGAGVALVLSLAIDSPAAMAHPAVGGSIVSLRRAPSDPGSLARSAAEQTPPTSAPATSAPATSAPATSAPATSAPATSAPTTSAPATSAPAAAANRRSSRGGRQRVGTLVGALFLCLALLAWASGYGLLGGRNVPLSQPLRGR